MQIILQFRVFLIAAIAVALVLEIGLALGTRKFGWQRRNLWIYGFFFGLTKQQCYYLAASWLWLLFVAVSAVFVVEMQICHLAMLLLLSAAKFAAWKRTAVLIRDLFNSALLFAAMMAENLLHSYLMETRFQIQIVVVLCLLILFIVLYAVYFAVRDVQSLMQNRAERKQTEKDREEKEQTKEMPESGRKRSRKRKNKRNKQSKRKKTDKTNEKQQEVVNDETEIKTDSAE